MKHSGTVSCPPFKSIAKNSVDLGKVSALGTVKLFLFGFWVLEGISRQIVHQSL